MISIYYLLDKRVAYERSKCVPVLADVKYEQNDKSEHFRFSTGITCNPKNFHQQEIHGREPNAESKNALLRRIKVIGEGIYFDGLRKGKLPDKELFKGRIKDTLKDAETEKTTLDHLNHYIDHLKAKKKSKSFIHAIGKLKEALTELRDKGVSIRFEDITPVFETKFRQLLNDRKYAINTVSAYINRLKTFMNWAAKSNLHQNQMYKNFEMEQEIREIIALTELEVEQIANLKISNHKHIQAGGTKLTRDWFIISTQTGLRYSDFSKLATAKLIKVTDGFDIHVKTQKTKADVVIPVSKLLYRILEEYNFEVPAPPSNQKYNAGLKRVAGLAEIKKEISSHSGRKTFATINYKRAVPVPLIMKITGHKSEKEFYKYIGVSLTENAAMVRGTSKDFQFEPAPKMVVNE